MKLSALIAAAALLSGCATKGGRCYPILGFGWTVVNTNQPAVVRTRSTIIGFGAMVKPAFHCLVGLGQIETIEVCTNQALVEFK